MLPSESRHQKGKFRIPKHAGPKTQTGNITTQHHILKPVSVFLYPYLVFPPNTAPNAAKHKSAKPKATILNTKEQNPNQQNPKEKFKRQTNDSKHKAAKPKPGKPKGKIQKTNHKF